MSFITLHRLMTFMLGTVHKSDFQNISWKWNDDFWRVAPDNMMHFSSIFCLAGFSGTKKRFNANVFLVISTHNLRSLCINEHGLECEIYVFWDIEMFLKNTCYVDLRGLVPRIGINVKIRCFLNLVNSTNIVKCFWKTHIIWF